MPLTISENDLYKGNPVSPREYQRQTEETAMRNMSIEELLNYVDRALPQVKALAEALEIELENSNGG